MSGRTSRRKGKVGEIEVAALLRPLFSEVRTKRAGGESATQDRGRDLLGTPGLCVQIKSMGRVDALKALTEAMRAALPDEVPLAMVKRTRGSGASSSGWVAVLPAQQFIGLWSLAREAMLRMKADLHAGQPAGNLADQPEPYDPGTDRQH